MVIICRQKSDTETQQSADTYSKEEEVVICRVCTNIVTKPLYQTMVNNTFSHAFANPHGHVFEIACFTRAQGCVSVSDPSSEFTWFPGFSWEIGVCSGCAAHLGWIFSRNRHEPEILMQFHGLILDKLIFP